MSVSVNEKNATAEVCQWIDQQISLNPAVSANRVEGLKAFQEIGLPQKKSEEYKHTPVTRLLQQNFDFEVPPAAQSDLDPKAFAIPSIDCHVIVLINGFYSSAHSTAALPEELNISNLSEALAAGDPVATRHFAMYADFKADAFAAWNTAAWNHGVLITVPDRTTIKKPILIYHLHDAREQQVVTASRNLFVVGKNSDVTVIEKYDSIGTFNHFSNTVTEVVVHEHAHIDLYSLQNDAGNRYHVGLTRVHQSDASLVNTFTFTLAGKLIRNNLQLCLDGEGIESHMFGLYLVDGDTIADNHTVADHRKPNSFSNEIYKGIMDDNSKGVFNGKIYVRPQAQKTNAFQANKNILLSDKATVNTKPQLEIWADDVKCSHGCTTGQLDEEAMFYLQTRGIHKETARAMMLYAFAIEVLNNVKHPELKSYIDRLVSERLHKNF